MSNSTRRCARSNASPRCGWLTASADLPLSPGWSYAVRLTDNDGTPMALAPIDPDAPDFVRRHVNLADARLGATALDCSDDFFADRQRMLNPEPPQFVPGKYDANGKWMDGWESRRKRGPGHDWCVVRLARPGRIHGVDLDTTHFTGNFPPAAGIEGCFVAQGDPDESTQWSSLLHPVDLGG